MEIPYGIRLVMPQEHRVCQGECTEDSNQNVLTYKEPGLCLPFLQKERHNIKNV